MIRLIRSFRGVSKCVRCSGIPLILQKMPKGVVVTAVKVLKIIYIYSLALQPFLFLNIYLILSNGVSIRLQRISKNLKIYVSNCSKWPFLSHNKLGIIISLSSFKIERCLLSFKHVTYDLLLTMRDFLQLLIFGKTIDVLR